MNLTKEEYIILYEKYLAGKCTDEEKQILEAYQDDFRLSDMGWDENLMGSKDEARQSLNTFLGDRILGSKGVRTISLMRSLAAAVTLLVISISLYFFVLRQPSNVPVAENTRFKNDVLPGKSMAVLTLDDGTEVVLDDAQNGLIARQGNTDVEKGKNGQLIYNINKGTADKLVPYNTVSTPSGGEYKVLLPDGTKVWLNAASALRFPTSFTGRDRRVELSGEAYFEVSGNKQKPFLVTLSKGVEVKVLGTHFNIMAYNDEENISTTLLEGTVEVNRGSDHKLLEPGQQAVFSKGSGDMKVESVNVENVIAWKNGYFIFKNEDLRSIMRQISRWYDVEVIFEANLGKRNFMGTISRTKNISELLNILEMTEAVHFKVEGRKITVIP